MKIGVVTIYLLSTLFLIAYCSGLKAQTVFNDEANSVGVDYSYPEENVMGAGLSFCDINADGWDDLSLATGEGDSLKIYLNNFGVFEEIDLAIIDTSNVKMVSWADIDNDGDQDLLLVGYSKLRLFENEGGLTFNEITEESGIEVNNLNSFSVAWGDYDNDSYLDFYLSNRLEAAGSTNLLFHNNGDLSFSDVTEIANISDSLTYSFSSTWLDFNNDGWQDIYVTSDKYNYPNRLLKNEGNGSFSDVSLSSNSYVFMDAMCATAEDYNYDGKLDIYVTNTPLGNLFLHNNGNETFTDTADGSGVAYYGIGWGSCFLDGNNDGDLDLYVSGMGDGGEFISSMYYENDGSGNFSHPSDIGFAGDSVMSFGNAIGDINNDGFLDIAVSNINNNVHLWVNQGNDSHWLKLNLDGVESNRDGIGSWIYLYSDGEAQVRYTSNGESFASQFSYNEGFGLADHSIVDSIQVKWLSGIEDRLYTIPSNQMLTIEEGSTNIEDPIIIKSDSLLCHGSDLILSIEQVFDYYVWSNNDSTSQITITEAGEYSVEVWNEYTAHKTATILVELDSQSLELGNDTILCIEDVLVLDIGDWDSIEWDNGSDDTQRVIDEEGFYFVDVTSFANCFYTDSILVTFEECLSVETNHLVNFEVFPNPCNDVIFIQANNTMIKMLRLYDASLKLVGEYSGKSTRQIDVSALNPGLYIIELESGADKHYKRIVKK